jgi:hypothetical protein
MTQRTQPSADPATDVPRCGISLQSALRTLCYDGGSPLPAYFELVAGKSDRVKIIDIDPTTEGHRTIGAIISAAENIRNLEQMSHATFRLLFNAIFTAR